MDKAKLGHEDPPPTIKLPYLSVHFIVASPLWVVEELEDGKFKAVQHPIPDDQYEEARERLLQLNQYSYDSDQWDERTRKAQEWADEERAKLFRGPKF